MDSLDLEIRWPGGQARVPAGHAATIGSSPACDVHLANQPVAGRHAQVTAGETGWVYTDLGGSTGSWVDGHRVVETLVGSGLDVLLGRGDNAVLLTLRPWSSEVAAAGTGVAHVGTLQLVNHAAAPTPVMAHAPERSSSGHPLVDSAWRVVPPVVVVAHLLIGLLLGGRASLWGDEAFTAQSVRQPVTALLQMLTRIDVNMAAYYLSAKAWSSVFGHSELALRSLSILLSAATVAVASLMMNRWFGTRAAAVAAVALGLNPFFVLLGLTARDFSMLALVTTLALWAFVVALAQPTQSRWLLVAALDVVALYTSLLAALAIATQVAFVLLTRRRITREQLVAGLAVAAGAVPTVVYLAPSNTLAWIGRPTLTQLVTLGWEVAGGRPGGLVLAFLGVIGLVLRPRMTGSPWRAVKDQRLILPAFAVGPLLLMLLLLPVQSLFVSAYFAIAIVPATLLAAAAASQRERWALASLSALLIIGLAGIAVHVRPNPALSHQDWRGAMALLNREAAPGDSTIFPNTFYRVAGEYYGLKGGGLTRTRPLLPSDPWFSAPPDTYDRIKRTGLYADVAAVTGAVSGAHRIWLIGPDDHWMREFTAALEGKGWSLSSEAHPDELVVRLLTPPVTTS